ncbi:hypothetical protein [Hymenobacter norwichensis]|uniref:hypothetical protein n=1 Tax=Hymenobacter norwichensis TaxID=223903 RepID=UPI0003B73547|nr:hypothetical protein [Hymenobacter norwichensis]
MPTTGTKHRGEVVAEAVRKSGVKLTKLHTALGISRPTLYRRFEEANLDFDFIREVGKVISYDFSQEFPELKAGPGVTPEPLAVFQLDNLEGCKDQLLHVYGLYTDILHKYNALLVKTSSPN